MSNLPPELLSFILLETQAEARAYNARIRKEPFPFAPDTLDRLRLTNRTFNSVILGSAQLWSFIAITGYITPKNKNDWFLTWERHIARYVEKSGSCPLDVTITTVDNHLLQIAHTQISLHTTRLRSLRFLTGHPPDYRVRPLIGALEAILTNHSLPKLETLTLPHQLVIRDAPRLTDLTCTGDSPFGVCFSKSTNIPLRSLRFTSYNTSRSSFVATVEPGKETLEFLDIFFRLGGFVPVEGLGRTPLLALHTLRVNFMCTWDLLTDYIHVPNLRSLTLSRPPRHPPHKAYCNPRPLEVMPLLHTLEWQAAAADSDETRESFEAILAACPNVRQLAVVEKPREDMQTGTFSVFGPLEEVLKVLAAKEAGSVKFCVGLEVLRVSCPGSELLDEVKEVREGALEIVQTDYRATY